MSWLNLRGAKRVSLEEAALKYEGQIERMGKVAGIGDWQSEDDRRAQLHEEFMRKAMQVGLRFEDRDQAEMIAWEIAHAKRS